MFFPLPRAEDRQAQHLGSHHLHPNSELERQAAQPSRLQPRTPGPGGRADSLACVLVAKPALSTPGLVMARPG